MMHGLTSFARPRLQRRQEMPSPMKFASASLQIAFAGLVSHG
jgi:hypothetical protein